MCDLWTRLSSVLAWQPIPCEVRLLTPLKIGDFIADAECASPHLA